MGIPNLNKLFLEKSKTNINKIHLNTLANKKIVIDTSIYLYKFMGQDKFIENFYLMISTFLYYNITPIFIFDGKPPAEKKELLKQRRINKKDAENKYKLLQENIKNDSISKDEILEIQSEMEKLKKQFIRIKDSDINLVKDLISYFGVQYIEAQGEADLLCAQMVISDQAWGCLSDDMDLFVFGCSRVLRYLSLMNHTIIYYDFYNVLKDLDINLNEFRYVITISGTDYNIEQNFNVRSIYNLFLKYKKISKKCDFVDWIDSKYTKNKEKLLETINLFTNLEHVDISNNVCFQKNTEKLIEFLKPYNFIFL